MKLLREEMDVHPENPDARFRQACVDFDIFKKYLTANAIRDEITHFTRRVNDLRVNATLIAATRTRMDLVQVSNVVTAVQAGMSKIQNELTVIRSATGKATTSLNQQELVRVEEDFHALKVGDMQLHFETSRTSNFGLAYSDGRRVQIGWTDYKGTVKGSPRTIRVYQGSDPAESWKEFISLLADHSPSPKLRSLVFHGGWVDILSKQDDAQNLEPWMNFFDFCDFLRGRADYNLSNWHKFALVNAQNGRLMVTHSDESSAITLPLSVCESDQEENFTDTDYDNQYEPFMEWFAYSGLSLWTVGSGGDTRLHGNTNTSRIQEVCIAYSPELQSLDWRTWSTQLMVHGVYIFRGYLSIPPARGLAARCPAWAIKQAWGGLNVLPEELHVFVQFPKLEGGRIAEPQIYWSTDPIAKETSSIPAGACKIRFKWEVTVEEASWEKHHYDSQEYPGGLRLRPQHQRCRQGPEPPAARSLPG
ncbi:hypothetical protein C8R44DRAFT_736285 [Mycena epipterygia]|nr:hypothetical protein C8R44DRAFT_736285 [Mycena epipterygia]